MGQGFLYDKAISWLPTYYRLSMVFGSSVVIKQKSRMLC